jgi:ornithine cyclodeaminase/alanine dehydrogenase-like protein (mu-crystallin family)
MQLTVITEDVVRSIATLDLAFEAVAADEARILPVVLAETGLPSALISAGYLNGLRTAAANAVAIDRLAREDSSVLGVLGAGHQAEFEVRAVAARRGIETVKVWKR